MSDVGAAVRAMLLDATFPAALERAITEAYRALGERAGRRNRDVAVRSSATTEDLADASFAGQR